MNKYGIRTICRDSTPGFRSKDITERWYDSEEERDRYYDSWTREVDPIAEFIANKGVSNEYIEYSYEKIVSEME